MVIDYLNNIYNSGILQKSFLGNSIFSYIQIVALFCGLFITSLIIKKIVNSKLMVLAQKENSKLSKIEPFLKKIDSPITVIFFILGLSWSTNILNFNTNITQAIQKIISTLYIIIFATILIRVIDMLIFVYLKPKVKETKTDLDDSLLPILKKFSKIIIVVIAAISIISNFGFDISSLVAGLGIGGLAFALAAKDILSNLFGGISILFDKPFKSGQRIKFMGVDGFIDEIGIRTTKIKTLDGTQVIVPNAKFTDNLIENVTREEARKVVMNLGLTYDTTNTKIKKAMSLVQKIINENKHTKNEPLMAFTDFKDFSLNILVIYYIQNKDAILEAKNDINLEIKKAFEKNKIEFAFPTQTIHVKK